MVGAMGLQPRGAQNRAIRLMGTHWIAAATLAMFLAGCSGVTDTIVRLDKQEQKHKDLPMAIVYAEAAKEKYKDALSNQSRLNTWTGAALIPLGTVVLGMATLGSSTTATAIVGLTGAGALGTATWLRNAPAQAAYLAGYTATNCAIEAVVPLNLPPETIADLHTNIVDLANYLPQLRAAIQAKAGSSGPNNVPLAAAAEKAGTDALANGRLLLAQTNQAGSLLTLAVDRISAEVDAAVVANQPSLAAIPVILGGLAQSYGQFTGAPLPASLVSQTSSTRGNEQALDLKPSLEELAAKVADATIRIQAVLALVDATSPAARLKACGVDPGSIVTAMTIEPAGPITINQGQQRALRIEGGQEPIWVDVPEAPKGLYLRARGPWGRDYQIDAAADAQPGTFQLIARDKAGKTRTAEIKVVETKAPVRAAGGSGTAADDPVFGRRPLAERKQLQRAICLTGNDIDGVGGPRTSRALANYRSATHRDMAGPLTMEEAATLLKEDEASIRKRCISQIVGQLKEPTAVIVSKSGSQLDLITKSAAVTADGGAVRITFDITGLKPPGSGVIFCSTDIRAALKKKLIITLDDRALLVQVDDAGKLLGKGIASC